MKVYQRAETIIIEASVTTRLGVLIDPSTSIKVTVTDSADTVVVSSQSMDKDDVGEYHYDYTPAVTALLGIYFARITVIHGGRTTIQDDVFRLT